MTNEPLYNQFSTIVLAGGKSERMGYPKPWLKTVNGYSFLENIINTYHNAGIKNIIVVLNANFSNGVWEVQINQLLNKATFALNHSPHLGRTHTIQLGLDKVTTPYVFIHNVDNPFVKKETIITLLKHSDKSQIIKPVYKSKSGHPVLVTKQLISNFLTDKHHNCSLKDFLNMYPQQMVDVLDESILQNINTENDYRKIVHECL